MNDHLLPGSSLPPNESELALAQFDYITGHYNNAIERLENMAAGSRLHPLRRAQASALLSLAYFQTSRFDSGARMRRRDPLTRLMRSFVEAPNQVTFAQGDSVSLPFLQSERWELPKVAVDVNGRSLVAALDTGGDLFSIPWSLASDLGIEPAVVTTGRFAAGRKARTGLARADQIALGGVSVANVPISINHADRPIVGTGLLRQFLPTIDYPAGKLLLRRRGTRSDTSGFPFWLVHTHLLIAAGTLNGVSMRLLVDSGLEVENQACLAVPDTTLERLRIPPPPKEWVAGGSGAGTARLRIGAFSISDIGLGPVSLQDQIGLTGVFPKQLTRATTLGLPVAGLISHNFLRHYRWTIDFERMQMSLAP